MVAAFAGGTAPINLRRVIKDHLQRHYFSFVVCSLLDLLGEDDSGHAPSTIGTAENPSWLPGTVITTIRIA